MSCRCTCATSNTALWFFRYLLSLGVDFLSAEELTAETFYRAYINFDKYKGESKIETWLCAIAKNKCRKDCKSRESISVSSRLTFWEAFSQALQNE